MTYGKNRIIKIFSLLVGLLLTLAFFGMLGDDGSQTPAVMVSGIWVLVMVWVLDTFMSKVILQEDRVIVKRGVFKRTHEELKYNKINNVTTTNIMGIGGIKIYVGNDKPIVFSNLSSFQKVKSYILDKID